MQGRPIAVAKAYSAIRLGGSTQAFHQRMVRDGLSLADFCDPKLTSLPGGEVVKDGAGQIRLGVGVSGGTLPQDTLTVEHLGFVVRDWLANLGAVD